MFITTRSAREAMLKMLGKVKQQPDSFVLKKFDIYDDALKYKKDIEAVDKTINKLL